MGGEKAPGGEASKTYAGPPDVHAGAIRSNGYLLSLSQVLHTVLSHVPQQL